MATRGGHCLPVIRNPGHGGGQCLSGPEEQGRQDGPRPCEGQERLWEAPHGPPMQSGPQEASPQMAPDEETEERSRGPGDAIGQPCSPRFNKQTEKKRQPQSAVTDEKTLQTRHREAVWGQMPQTSLNVGTEGGRDGRESPVRLRKDSNTHGLPETQEF